MLRPFPTAPDIRRYFPASVMEEARERLTRAINRWEGPAHVVGAAGTGKSLLLEVLAAQFREQMSVVALIGAQLCTRRALLQTMLFELGLPHRRMDEGELRLSLVEYLRGHDGNRQQMLLLVDEADALPIRLLQELRVLTNVADQGQPQVSLILAGSAILEERFAEPEMETFSQRISARCYLSPLGRKETFAYVRSQIAASGGDVDQLFNLEGLEAIFAATDGVPRLINQLGDQLIWMSQKTGYQPLDGAIVQQAWSDLQQLPAPWNHSTFSSVIQADDQETESGVIEFGDLHEVPPPHSLNSETPPVESSCDSCPNGDDMPASIPFDPQQGQLTAHPNLELEMETLDVTEKLLQDLSDIQSEPFMESVDGTPPEAYNPFEESFTTEEVVFDQYASFQAQLLSTTSRVVNHQDRQFASELECCELNSNTVAVTPPLEQTLATELRAQSTMHRPDGDHSALLVQGRQFRQLFSQLESGNRPSIYG
jgi:type II secretory pathway predicted ATPase ExeA